MIDGIPVDHIDYTESETESKGVLEDIVDNLRLNGLRVSNYTRNRERIVIQSRLSRLNKLNKYDLILSTVWPFGVGIASSKIKGPKKCCYIMDPPYEIQREKQEKTHSHSLNALIKNSDLILCAPATKTALLESGYEKYSEKIIPVGFPMIEEHKRTDDSNNLKMNKDKINLLFCGWLYSDIRSPEYFLHIVEKLDERFCVWFMGRECDKLFERFSIKTKAEIKAIGYQPYQIAVNAMADADIMINIGNSVPVHTPSKTLEYINTGKPTVNFYKLDNCPTLYYTERYPLCLNIREDGDLASDITAFEAFCVDNKGKSVERQKIEEMYKECTPEYIAKVIMECADN